MELLRLELPLSPAVKQATADRLLRVAVRKTASQVQLAPPPAGQLRQVQASEGSVYALLGVPKDDAHSWLRASGCGGLLVRPFWMADGGNTIKKSDYEVFWLKSCTTDANKLWEALWEQRGFCGVVTNGKGLGLRVAPGTDVATLQAQIRFIMQDDKAQVRCPVLGQRWWRLGPLTDAEVWHAADLVASCGLSPLRGELRLGRLGPFRSVVYFAAVGDPTRYSLDDGSWGSSEAALTPANPPPQRPPPARGAALAATSQWAGPRRPAAQLPSTSLPPAQAWLSATAPDGFPPLPARGGHLGPAAVMISQDTNHQRGLPGGAAMRRTGGPPGGGGRPGRQPWEEQLATLTDQLAELLQENRELRKEVGNLRRQVEAARGLQQHQPYALSSVPPQPAAPLAPPHHPSLGRPRMVGELTPEHRSSADGVDIEMRSPPVDVEPKRVCRSLAMSLDTVVFNTGLGPQPGAPPGVGEAVGSDVHPARASAAPGGDGV